MLVHIPTVHGVKSRRHHKISEMPQKLTEFAGLLRGKVEQGRRRVVVYINDILWEVYGQSSLEQS